jgi:hypothetical protein
VSLGSPDAPPPNEGTLSFSTSLLDDLLSVPHGIYLLGFVLGTVIAIIPLLAIYVMA